MTNRKFGIEIELTGLSMSQAVSVMSSCDVPFNTSTHYRHAEYNKWKVMSDASVYNGCEVVSRVLQGREGLQEVVKVANALVAAGATADRSCGLHVHVDASDLNGNHVRNIVKRYAKFESTIDSFMPRSRRGNSNTYCQSMVEFVDRNERNNSYYRSSWNSPDKNSVARAIDVRYVKVNLQSLLRQNTVEFRQHSGSVNATKITNWINFVLEFVEESKRIVPHEQQQPQGFSTSSLSATSYNLWSMFRNEPNIIITYDRLARTIPRSLIAAEVSVLRRKLGVKIKNIRNVGYMYIPPVVPTNTTTIVNTSEDNVWNGISQNLRSFYEQRALTLR